MRTTARILFGAAPLLTLIAAGALVAGASAQPAPPDAGDPRATAVSGNVDIGQPGDACDVVGLPGNEAVLPPNTYTTDGTYINITAHPPGAVITGVVVKGGNAYNVYPAGNLGTMPWSALHAPLAASGKPAAVSHWFVCLDTPTTTTTTTTTTAGSTTTTTGSTTGTTTTTGTTPAGTTTTTPIATTPITTTTTPSPGSTTTTTTTTPVAGALVPGSGQGLADTGFDGWWLVFAGLVLLAAGAALLASPKLRHRLRR